MGRRLAAAFASGGGVQVVSGVPTSEAVTSKIRACILTMKGSVPSQPKLGSNATAFTFKMNSQSDKALVSHVIQEDLARCVPEAKALVISIDDTVDPNVQVIRVRYTFEGEAYEAVAELGA